VKVKILVQSASDCPVGQSVSHSAIQPVTVSQSIGRSVSQSVGQSVSNSDSFMQRRNSWTVSKEGVAALRNSLCGFPVKEGSIVPKQDTEAKIKSYYL